MGGRKRSRKTYLQRLEAASGLDLTRVVERNDDDVSNRRVLVHEAVLRRHVALAQREDGRGLGTDDIRYVIYHSVGGKDVELDCVLDLNVARGGGGGGGGKKRGDREREGERGKERESAEGRRTKETEKRDGKRHGSDSIGGDGPCFR